MRKKLPGIFETLKRAVQLCIQSYPYMILFLILQMGLGFFAPNFEGLMKYIEPTETNLSIPINWLHMGLYALTQSLLSAGTLLNLYMLSQGKYISFSETCHIVGKRLIAIVIANLVFGIPLLFTTVFMTIAISNHVLPSSWILISWGAILIVFSTYALFTHLIAALGHSRGLSSLNHSWQLVSGYWLDTFLIFIAGLGCFELMSSLINDHLLSQVFSAFISGPCLGALFVVHYQHLLEAKR
ncbi:MAG: hypothetical protein U1E78_00935 [Gammaproteobacteria bacterium]